MTDEQIIQALECCSWDDMKECEVCPYDENETDTYCVNHLLKDVVGLIDSQKAEIEMLKHDRKKLKREFLTVRYETKAKAIKEFVQKHREVMMDFCDDDDQISLKMCEYDANTNNLAKEITGR